MPELAGPGVSDGITDNQCLFVGGLILDPKKLFGREGSITSRDVRNAIVVVVVIGVKCT
jgi:hypothetical protein